jgi:ankyrin repeat protein
LLLLQKIYQASGAESSFTSLPDLPPHLQHLIFASAAAPLTTCKASAAVAQDTSLAAQWLLVKHKQPLWRGVKHQLWDACERMLGTHQYTPGKQELCDALKLAALYGGARVVSSLLQWCCKEHHQACDTCRRSLEYALFKAMSKGHVPVVRLLAQHPAITAQQARDAVCAAAMHGQLEVLQALITTRPDASDPQLARSPMHDAAEYGQLAAMQVLVQHGADVHNSQGKPWSSRAIPGVRIVPAYSAAVGESLEVIMWLHQQGMTEEEVGRALMAAARQGNARISRYLLQECLVNPELYGLDALKPALQYGCLEVACLLLEAGTPTYGMTRAFMQHALRGVDSYQLNVLLQAAAQPGQEDFADMLKELIAAANQDGA